jgi:hypothetical protein
MINLIAFLIVGSMAVADPNSQREIDFEFNVDYYSEYVSRGQRAVDEPVIQPSISASIEDFTFALWGNLNTHTDENSWEFDETNTVIEYSKSFFDIDKLHYAVGFIYYTYPNTPWSDTAEVYAGLFWDVPLSPNIIIYRDIDEANGNYISFGVEHWFDRFKTNASIGWGDSDYNEVYWETESDGFSDLNLQVSLPFEIKKFVISPNITYTTVIDQDLRDSDTYGDDSDFIVFGVSLTFKKFRRRTYLF